ITGAKAVGFACAREPAAVPVRTANAAVRAAPPQSAARRAGAAVAPMCLPQPATSPDLHAPRGAPQMRPHRRTGSPEPYPRFGGRCRESLGRVHPNGGLTLFRIADKMDAMRLRVLFVLVLVAALVPASAFGAKSALKKVSARLTPGAVAPKSKAKASGSIV